MAWSDTFLKVLKDNDVRTGRPMCRDNVLTPLHQRRHVRQLNVPSQIPTVMVISERGTMGEFNVGQRLGRPALADALGIAHHTLTDEATMPFTVDRSIKQAFMTQASVAFILSPLLTGGNPAGNDTLKSAS